MNKIEKINVFKTGHVSILDFKKSSRVLILGSKRDALRYAREHRLNVKSTNTQIYEEMPRRSIYALRISAGSLGYLGHYLTWPQ